ncbi:hypothetical protein Syun_017687 [Stephania yunnanensis]|uniref:Uncharacterized protein n=1 Tax=Stephania yunnanensis TaxID=152371 RepID=A0AAP0P5C5_9MAGN
MLGRTREVTKKRGDGGGRGAHPLDGGIADSAGLQHGGEIGGETRRPASSAAVQQ